jgi:hypothetical protein
MSEPSDCVACRSRPAHAAGPPVQGARQRPRLAGARAQLAPPGRPQRRERLRSTGDFPIVVLRSEGGEAYHPRTKRAARSVATVRVLVRDVRGFLCWWNRTESQ